MADNEIVFDYSKDYGRPVDAAWVARQFKIYDKYVREYYNPRELLNKFDGTSYNSKGEVEFNIVFLGFVEHLDSGRIDARSIYISNELEVSGKAGIHDDTTLYKNLNVKEDSVLEGNLEVDKAATIKGLFTGEDNAVLKKNLEVDKDADIGGNLKVTKNAEVGGNFNAVGNISTNANLTVDNDARIKGNSKVDGDSTVDGDSYIKGNSIINGQNTVKGCERVGDSLEVENNLVVNHILWKIDTETSKLADLM